MAGWCFWERKNPIVRQMEDVNFWGLAPWLWNPPKLYGCFMGRRVMGRRVGKTENLQISLIRLGRVIFKGWKLGMKTWEDPETRDDILARSGGSELRMILRGVFFGGWKLGDSHEVPKKKWHGLDYLQETRSTRNSFTQGALNWGRIALMHRCI